MLNGYKDKTEIVEGEFRVSILSLDGGKYL